MVTFLSLILLFLLPVFMIIWFSEYLDRRAQKKEIQKCITLYQDIIALQTEMNMPLYGENIFNVQVEQVKEGSMTIRHLKTHLQRYRAHLFDKRAELQIRI